ncbi:amino acid adenylation domain-containing protein [Streptomyces sp. NPDC051677]|uniref:amino acid adenylation domain-containing protein n=1 Tax=Streptomyces sp. NPDC051677 TaxID=3365669 RepID=UPI0037D04BC7
MTTTHTSAEGLLDTVATKALGDLPSREAESFQLAAAVLALSYMTHDDSPVVRVVHGTGPARTAAFTVDPDDSGEAVATGVNDAPDTGEEAQHAILLGTRPDPPEPLEPGGDTTVEGAFRLTLAVDGGRVSCTHNGAPGAVLDAETLVSVYLTLLPRMLADPERPVATYELLHGLERRRVLLDFNETAHPLPPERTLHGVFHVQALRTPDAVAVSADHESLTYRELDERTDRLARYLVGRGVTAGTVVAVLMERCLDLPVAVIGILKAGGAYLPLAPDAPPERLVGLVAQSGAPLVLMQPGLAAPESIPVPSVPLDDPELYAGPDPGFQSHSGPRDLAYVIYTSGSTGRPKGVEVEHESVVNRLNWMQRRYPLTESDTLLQKTPVIFDVSVWELFWWFFAGARMHLLAPGMERFPLAISKTVRKQRVSVLHFVPSMLGIFLEYLKDGGGDLSALASLRWCFSSGESLLAGQVTTFGELFAAQGTRLVNLYGPTEATVDVTGYDCPATAFTGVVPIGRPIDNTRVYVLRHGRPMPVGVYGTLFLAGAGVARGYLGDPELTAGRFVPEYGRPDGRMYDTGDIGRWLPSGDLEYLGRTDNQIKIRGIRIDLGEIENVLLQSSGVTECVAVLESADPSRPRLHAAVSGVAGLTEAALREHAARWLPEYMVPVVYHRLERLPRTSSGKLDRKAVAQLAHGPN